MPKRLIQTNEVDTYPLQMLPLSLPKVYLGSEKQKKEKRECETEERNAGKRERENSCMKI